MWISPFGRSLHCVVTVCNHCMFICLWEPMTAAEYIPTTSILYLNETEPDLDTAGAGTYGEGSRNQLLSLLFIPPNGYFISSKWIPHRYKRHLQERLFCLAQIFPCDSCISSLVSSTPIIRLQGTTVAYTGPFLDPSIPFTTHSAYSSVTTTIVPFWHVSSEEPDHHLMCVPVSCLNNPSDFPYLAQFYTGPPPPLRPEAPTLRE